MATRPRVGPVVGVLRGAVVGPQFVVPPPAVPAGTVAPVAAFSSTFMAPLTGTFADLSTNTPTAWSWDFGDGSTSSVQNPSHVFATAGAKSVSLTASNAAGSSIATGSLTVYAYVGAAASATLGSLLSMSFTDQSTGSPTAWSWDFGDGTTSTSQNPTHVFATEGQKVVSLTASNPANTSITTLTVQVVNKDGPGPYYLPTSVAGWQAFGVVPPTMQWGFQEPTGTVIFPTFTSGGLAASVLTVTSITPSYQQSVAGWQRYFVLQSTEVSSGRIATTTSSLNPGVSGSLAVFALVSPLSGNGASRPFLMGNTDIDSVQATAAGGMTAKFSGSTTSTVGAGTLTSITSPRPVVWWRNCTTQTCGATSDFAHASGTMSNHTLPGAKGLGNTGGVAGAYAVTMYAIFTGSAAEVDWKAVIRSLGWTLSY